MVSIEVRKRYISREWGSLGSHEAEVVQSVGLDAGLGVINVRKVLLHYILRYPCKHGNFIIGVFVLLAILSDRWP